MIIPATLIVGSSGSGKSSSIKNLPKDKTRILNIEKKVLPFREGIVHPGNRMINSAVDFDSELDGALKNNDVENIVIESHHRYSDKVLELSKQLAKGYDIYNVYADRMTKFITKLMTAENKYIFVIANAEMYKVENPNGTTTSKFRASFHGNLIEKMGGIESFYTIVLFTDLKVSPQGQRDYGFTVNSDGVNSAKTPDGMFNVPRIPNDLVKVKEAINLYYGIKELPKELPSVLSSKAL